MPLSPNAHDVRARRPCWVPEVLRRPHRQHHGAQHAVRDEGGGPLGVQPVPVSTSWSSAIVGAGVIEVVTVAAFFAPRRARAPRG